MAYAVIKTGGKQFVVEKGSTIRIPSIEAEAGKSIELDALLSGEGPDAPVGGAAKVSTTVAETLAAPPTGASGPSPDKRASSSIDLPASASIEGMRIVLPFSTTNCFPPVLITAYAISLPSQSRHVAIEKSFIIGILLANGNRSRLPHESPDSALCFRHFRPVLR